MALTDLDRLQYDWLPKATNYKGNQSDIVFFIINVKTLFGVDLNYPGMIGALNKAFEAGKSKVPVDTGLTKNSFKGRKIDDYNVYYFFDPADIVGKVRKKQIVKDYYPKYIAESAKNFNWLSIVMYNFYETLFAEVRKLFNAKSREDDREYEFVPEKDAKYSNILQPKIDESWLNKMRKEYKEMKERRNERIEIQKAQKRLKRIEMEKRKQELLEKKRARKAGNIDGGGTSK